MFVLYISLAIVIAKNSLKIKQLPRLKINNYQGVKITI